MLTFIEIMYFFCVPKMSRSNFGKLRQLRNKLNSSASHTMNDKNNELFGRSRRHRIIFQNEVQSLLQRTQIDLLKYIFQHSKLGMWMWAVAAIIFFSLSIWFIQIIWMRSYSNPLIVTLSNEKISILDVST